MTHRSDGAGSPVATFWRRLSLMFMALGGMALAVAVALRWGESQDGVVAILGFWTLCAGAFIGLLGALIFALAKSDRRNPPRSRMDQAHEGRRERLFLLPLSMIVLVGVATVALEETLASGAAPNLIRAGMLLVLIVVAPISLMGTVGERRDPELRRVLNDEFSRQLRARAWSVGYLVAMLGGASLYALALFDRDAAWLLSPLILGAAAVAPGLWFACADRAAEGDD
ncbi:MAG: hypothetical protein ACK4Z5_10205 [Brevundimonas sp.]